MSSLNAGVYWLESQSTPGYILSRKQSSSNAWAISSQASPALGAHPLAGFGVGILELTQSFGSVFPSGLELVQLLLKSNLGVSFGTPGLGFGFIDDDDPTRPRG
jgi:hypothetical protein